MSLRYQDTDLRSLKAAYKPLISKELGRSIDSDTPTYYGNNGVSREVLARTNDVVRLTKALASGAGIKFAANTALAAGLGGSGGILQRAKSAGLSAANRAAALLANAATAGTGYHTGDPLFPYSYLGTSNFFNVGSFFGVGSTVIGDDPEAGLNTDKKLKEYYLKSELLSTPPYPAGNKIENPGNGLKDDKGDPKVNSSILDNAIVEQRLDAFERNGLDREVVGERGREIKPSDKKFTEFKVEPKTEKLKTAIGDRTDDQIEELKSFTETREDQISKVYKVGTNPSYDYSTRVDEFNRVDQLNLLNVTDTDLGDNSYDFIKFKMVIKAPGEGADSYLFFRSYLLDYNDNYDGQWSGVNYIGRAEPLYNYTGFNRQINFNFMIAAGSKKELLPLYNKLNRLVSTTAPSYSSTFMRGVYVQLTIGDLLVDTPGFFNSLSLSWNTSYPWEIGYDPNATTSNGSPKVPAVLDVSANFTPVHNFTPEYKQPFLLANV